MPHRFRIRRVNEDAADGSDLVAPTGYGDRHCEWCNQTQLADGWDRCLICNRPLNHRGWLCECGHRNPPNAHECESCGVQPPP